MSAQEPNSVSPRRRALLVVLPVVIAAGLASRRWPEALPAVVAAYAGDILWAVMVYVLIAFVWGAAPSRVVALWGLAVAFVVELSQTAHLPWLDMVRRHHLGALVLGQGFLWSDLACYAVGVAAAFLVDTAWQRRRRVLGGKRR